METRVIPSALRDKCGRQHGDNVTTLRQLSAEAARCTRCELYRRASGTVFGEGPRGASVVLVGEQPGDAEDKAGRPFVGPAGRLLDRALAESGIPRDVAYLTNAVKHFKWEESGKRRLHKPPNRTEIVACRLWLEAELAIVRPAVVVALGATAGSALTGPGFRVSAHRGDVEDLSVGDWTGRMVTTVHPSAVLRSRGQQARDDAYGGLVADLRTAARAAGSRTA
jgi:uracil-DNA glycosylase